SNIIFILQSLALDLFAFRPKHFKALAIAKALKCFL
ncbi:MAG: hypothetical protein ACI88Z_000159, partial [Sphingobacteriales bacterium]